MNTLADIILSLPTKPTTAELLQAFIQAEKLGYEKAHQELNRDLARLSAQGCFLAQAS